MACSLQGHIPLVAPSLHHRSRSADAQVRSVLPGARQGGGQGLPAGSCTQCWGLANPTPCATMTQRVPEWRAGGTSSRPGGCSVPLAPGLCWHCVPGPWWGLQAGAHGAPPPLHTHRSHLRPLPLTPPLRPGPQLDPVARVEAMSRQPWGSREKRGRAWPLPQQVRIGVVCWGPSNLTPSCLPLGGGPLGTATGAGSQDQDGVEGSSLSGPGPCDRRYCVLFFVARGPLVLSSPTDTPHTLLQKPWEGFTRKEP